MQAFKTIDKTVSIFKTNPRLTGNVKLVVKDNNTVFMTQLNEASKEQSQLPYSSTLNYATNVSTFLTSYVKGDKFLTDNFNLSDKNTLRSKVTEQYDLQYQYGAKYGTKHGKHRFFAPLWITDTGCPKYFVIVGRPKSINKIGTKTGLHETMKMEVIKTFDIQNGTLGKIYQNIISFDGFRNEPFTFNVTNEGVIYGINISKKIQTSAKVSIKQLRETEYMLLEADNYFTNQFKENGMIIQNLINFEFEFELPDSGLYEIAGYYVDDVNNIPVNDDFQIDTYAQNNAGILSNTMTVSKKLNERRQVEFKQFAIDANYPTSYDVLIRRFTSPTVSFVNVVQNRFTQFEVRRSIAVGDYVAIIENGIEYRCTCDWERNSGDFFKYSDDIPTQMENLNDALQRLKTRYLYKSKFDKFRQNIIIECMNYKNADNFEIFIDSPDAFYPLLFAATLANPMQQKYRYEFSAFSTLNNTLQISNISTSLAGIDVKEIAYVVLKIGSVEQTLHIKNILYDYDNNKLIVIFNEEFTLGENLNENLVISLYSTKHIELTQLQFYDIYHFDYTMNNFNIPSKHNVDFNIIQLQTTYTDVVDSVKKQFPVGSDLPFISEVKPDELKFSGNPYDLFKEYDQQTLSLFNKINIASNKWGSSKGVNCYNLPISANVSMAYNQANLSPVLDSTHYHNIQSLQYDYFVIGKAPSDPELMDFAVKDLTVDDLKAPNPMQHFTHNLDRVINEIRFKNSQYNYTHTFSKKSIKDKVFAIFKGVEYELPAIFSGYKFTVVHIASSNALTPIVSEIINRIEKTFIITIEFPITDTILTGVELEPDLFLSNKLKMHRYIYYTNINDINTSDKIIASGINAFIPINSIGIGKKMPRKFGNLELNDFRYEQSNGTVYFAIDINSVQKLADIFRLNGNAVLFNPDTGYQTSFNNIVDIQDSYIWVENIIDSDGMNLYDEYIISYDNLSLNPKVNTAIAKTANSTLRSTNFNTNSNRYYPIAFSNFVKLVNGNSKLYANVNKIKSTTIIEYLRPEESGLSHIVNPSDNITSYLIQRYAINCVPTCIEALVPMTMVRPETDPVTRATDFIVPVTDRLTLPKTGNILSDFGLFKIGNANTLTTDDLTNTNQPIHTLIGETIYALSKAYPVDFSPYADRMRFYDHRNSYSLIDNKNVMVNHSSLVSTLFNVNSNQVQSRYFNTDFITLNVVDILTKNIKTLFGFFTDDAVRIFVEYILSRYQYKVEFTDIEGDKLQPILNADHVQNSIYENSYTFSKKTNIIATITML